MNKMLKGLLVTALAVSAAQVQAHTNKTFMMPRPAGVNLPMYYTTFNELVHRHDTDKFGGNFQVTGFYQASTDSARAGRYFGINNKNNVTLKYEQPRGTATASTGVPATIACPESTVTCDLDLGYILHDAANTLEGKSVVVKLNPEQRIYGARFDYYQDLEKILKGLYLTIALPVVHVENDMNLEIGCPPACPPATTDTTLEGRVRNYFKGCVDVSLNQTTDKQAVLTKARIDGKRSKTGVADIDVRLGYNFLQKDNYHVGINFGVTFPTGNEAKADYVFEPMVGNGQHWGVGFGFDSAFRVWESDNDANLKIALAFDYRYLFENSECRTLGINKPAAAATTTTSCPTSCDTPRCGTARNWGQYHLLGDNENVGAAPRPLIPAANVTTLNVDVTPGSQFDGIVALAYNNGGFTFDLGYNLYLREAERVKTKCGPCPTTCPTPATTTACPTTCSTGCPSSLQDNRYGVVARGFLTNRTATGTSTTDADFNNQNGAFDNNTGTAAATINGADFDGCKVAYLKCSELNTCVAETPSQDSHKIFAGLGYIFKEWDNPLMLGTGGSYEFANSAALDQWAIWLKVGVGF